MSALPTQDDGPSPFEDDPPNPYLDWGELQNQTPPARKWAIPGWIGMGHATLLVGPGATGKTLLIQQIISCLCLGRSFIGDAPEQPMNCLMWACEDEHDELWRRQIAIAKWLKVDLDEFQGRLHIEPRFGKENTIFGPNEEHKTGWSARLTDISDQAKATNSQIVVLDNVGQIFGGNENSRYDVTRFINGLCGALRGKAVILIAHPAKNEGSQYSGSTAWENCVRTRLYLGPQMPDKPQDEDDEQDSTVRYFAKRKTNYSEKDWRVLRFAENLLLPDEINAQGGLIVHLVKQKAERVVLEAVQQFYNRQIRVVTGRSSPDYLVNKMTDAGITDSVRKQEIISALARLMIDGKIVEIPFGTSSKNRTKHFTLAPG
jgi:hypothetical protein